MNNRPPVFTSRCRGPGGRVVDPQATEVGLRVSVLAYNLGNAILAPQQTQTFWNARVEQHCRHTRGKNAENE